MLFSIIVINYNYEQYLPEAIESALGQSYPHIEVLVVDDGSTDNSKNVIARYGDRIRPVFKENGGQGSGYNAGFEQCHGDIVLFLDADDVLAPTACEEVVKAMAEGISKVQFKLTIVGPDSKPLGGTLPTLVMHDGDVKHLLMKFGTHGGPPASGNAFRREFLNQVLPMPASEWRMGSDNFLTLQAPFYGNIMSINKELGMYRQHRKHGGQNQGDFQMGIGNASGLNKVLELVSQDDRFLGETARKHGFAFNSALHGRNPGFNKNLICAILLGRAPEGSPSRQKLGIKGGWACLWYPLYPGKRRLFGALWFLVAGLAPRPIALRTVRFALDPTSRSKPPKSLSRERATTL